MIHRFKSRSRAELARMGLAPVPRSVVDKQGRITIPKAIREYLGLKPGDKIEWITEAGTLRLRRVETSHAA